MDIDARYEFLEKVGSGSFATVYRARDLELGREVAIKQIHPQYLENPKELERYWSEAQLLASLHHPNIVTIFDIYRDRGWLILELMQSNLAERMSGRQMDLRALRTTIAHCLRALKYLHSRGIIHGDIKPSNMMIDARRRVKLGDFGLARRVSDEDGSLLKGTTKYMAPEVVSEEFGEIGPASDLYSLGFASYDLMCGPNFESLFPGLSAFGRNKQVAWMMWHAAADRRLPEINRVLEGVPDDLQKVIPKLCEKDQAKRYKTADDALSDLKIDLKVVNRGEPEIADSDEPAGMDPARKKRLMLAGAALLASLIASVVMWILLTPEKKPTRHVTAWRVTGVDTQNRRLRLVEWEGEIAKYLEIPGNARISLQRPGGVENVPFEDLKSGDRIQVEYEKDGDKSMMRIRAARPVHNRGHVQSVDLQEGRLRVVLDDDTSKEAMSLRFPERIDVVLNLSREEWDAAKNQEARDRLKQGHRITRNEVRPNDRVEVAHLPEVGGKRGYVLTGLVFVHRIRELSGRIIALDVPRERVTVEVSNRKMNLPVHKESRITLREEGKPARDVKLDKLQKGDFVTVRYDTEYRELHATRGSNQVEGTLAAVRVPQKEFILTERKTGGNTTFAVDDQTRVQINSESATFADLRFTDRVKVLFETGTGDQKTATTVTAERLPRVDRRVLLAGVRRFDDKSLPEVGYASANVNVLKDAMLKRYAVDKERLVALDDPTAATLKKEVADLLDRSGPNVPNVVIYICTHGFVADGKVYLAGRKIDGSRIAATGWPLDELLALVEKCSAPNKILLLDLSHEWKDTTRSDQPSTAEMLTLAKTPLKTTTVIAANSGKERGRFLADKTHGVFAHAVAQGFRGSADASGDLVITGSELFADLQRRMKAAGNVQTPVRISH